MDVATISTIAALLGRILIGFYFFFFALWNTYYRKPSLEAMKSLPFAPFFLFAGVALELCTGILIMIGEFSAIAAALLIPFVLFATLIFHRFWTIEPGPVRTLNTVIFIGNITVTLGALLLVVATIK